MGNSLNKRYGVTPYNEFDSGVESKTLALAVPVQVVFCCGTEIAIDCYGEFKPLSRVYTIDDYGYLMSDDSDITHEQAAFLHWKKEMRTFIKESIQCK